MAQETTGKVDFKVGKETYQTWYRIVGTANMKSANYRPVVVLHGGPGMSHHYMLPHVTLYEHAGIPVIFYDQIGNGESTHLRDAPKEFWTPELFMDELDNLIGRLDIASDFDLLGQSWGGMLAGQYAASRNPKGLKRLVIANSPASMELYIAGTNDLLAKGFHEDFVKMLRKHEADGTTDAQEYQEGMIQFYRKHVCDMDPWPEELVKSFKSAELNPTVYGTMIGPSEFNIVGTLKDWSIVDILSKISCPTLLVSSPKDEVQPLATRPWFSAIPKIKWVELQSSTHLALFEEPEKYFDVLIDFLLYSSP